VALFPINPAPSPKRLSLGPLEAEILDILWTHDGATARQILDHILEDPDRELTQPSVMTVLHRLVDKGWLRQEKRGRHYWWRPVLSRDRARALQACEHLDRFLALGNADAVAACVDRFDAASLDKIEALAAKLREVRRRREGDRSEGAEG
jgi:predicted transcriptional regulator